MARAFFRAAPDRMNVERWGSRVQHPTAGRTYEMLQRDGRYFVRRTEPGVDPHEAEIHYVMGSGNHVRSYLHRTPQGRLAELPVAWYQGLGFALSPGYDRVDSYEFRRKISTDCMFCHNAYPAADMRPAPEPVFAEPLPEGIDCQRCHGPGSAHVAAGGKGGIVNPAKLDRDRSLEVCMQCHLETTSFPLPNSLVRFDRGAFSYRPGEPLGSFQTFFDHAPGSGRQDKFEIVSSVYRLRQSACFQKSGKMQCTTCHDPHARGVKPVSQTCLSCHAAHTKSQDCAGCHMPKRLTEDVVHSAMTDHKIQRHAPADAMKPRTERHETPGKSYVGEVVQYYPPAPDELYLAVAQVVQRSNLKGGIPRLEAAIEKHKPTDPRFRFALAEAHDAAGDHARAVALFRALPDFPPALRRTGDIAALEKGTKLTPEDAAMWHALGEAYRAAGRTPDARTAFEKAAALEPDFAEAHNSLGAVWAEQGDVTRAEAEFRLAVRHKPDYAEARLNLGNARLLANDVQQAEFQYQAAARLDPKLAAAHEALGTIAASRGDARQARERFESALRADPESERAHLGLGSVLASLGDSASARAHLRKAAASPNPAIRQEAAETLRMIGAQ